MGKLTVKMMNHLDFAALFKEAERQRGGEKYRDVGKIMEIHPQIEKDLEDITYDMENRECQLMTASNKVPLMIARVWGDTSHEVYFIIYADESDSVRAYFPRKGNTFNPLTGNCFFYDDEFPKEDMEFICKKLGIPIIEDKEEFLDKVDLDEIIEIVDSLHDRNKMLEDFFEHVEVV